jgi:hypothetical protein
MPDDFTCQGVLVLALTGLMQKIHRCMLTVQFYNLPLYSTWQNIRRNICKSGCILITVPSLEESVCIGDEGQVGSELHAIMK